MFAQPYSFKFMDAAQDHFFRKLPAKAECYFPSCLNLSDLVRIVHAAKVEVLNSFIGKTPPNISNLDNYIITIFNML